MGRPIAVKETTVDEYMKQGLTFYARDLRGKRVEAELILCSGIAACSLWRFTNGRTLYLAGSRALFDRWERENRGIA